MLYPTASWSGEMRRNNEHVGISVGLQKVAAGLACLLLISTKVCTPIGKTTLDGMMHHIAAQNSIDVQ